MSLSLSPASVASVPSLSPVPPVGAPSPDATGASVPVAPVPVPSLRYVLFVPRFKGATKDESAKWLFGRATALYLAAGSIGGTSVAILARKAVPSDTANPSDVPAEMALPINGNGETVRPVPGMISDAGTVFGDACPSDARALPMVSVSLPFPVEIAREIMDGFNHLVPLAPAALKVSAPGSGGAARSTGRSKALVGILTNVRDYVKGCASNPLPALLSLRAVAIPGLIAACVGEGATGADIRAALAEAVDSFSGPRSGKQKACATETAALFAGHLPVDPAPVPVPPAPLADGALPSDEPNAAGSDGSLADPSDAIALAAALA